MIMVHELGFFENLLFKIWLSPTICSWATEAASQASFGNDSFLSDILTKISVFPLLDDE